ncbi:hypothetical protein [uncultured Ruminococcus sp.]|uniref:hypothetical protein n=1 Tax=uncultured Ruminococcus sp. TaxID=165186 RepID=UPI00258CB5F7|nr:hypothetical protein [uncultured Ruminococcus sp.]
MQVYLFIVFRVQMISQGVTLLFFFAEKKKRSKKRKEFAFHLYCKIQVSPEDITFSINKTPPEGHTGGLPAVTLPFLQLKLGRKVGGDPPLSLLKRKKEAKKEKSSRFPCTVRFKYHPKIIQETVTIDSHQQKSPGGANRRLPPP